jgi:hypothetical protein
LLESGGARKAGFFGQVRLERQGVGVRWGQERHGAGVRWGQERHGAGVR